MEIRVGSLWECGCDACEVIASTKDTVTFTVNDNYTHTRSLGVFLATWEPMSPCTTQQDSAVHSPQHYQVFPDKEAIEIIASSMTTEQFYGYCLGNFLKYRLRIGAKDEVQQELGKSNKYKELYEKHRHMCK